jgi:hypothetical protein
MLWTTVNRPPIATQVDSMIRHHPTASAARTSVARRNYSRFTGENRRCIFGQIGEGHAMFRHERQDLRGEFRDEFEEIRALMRPSISQLDQWVQTLESESSTL